MTWHSEETEPVSENGLDEENEEALFGDDSGELPLDTRRVLVRLLSGPSLDCQSHSKLWTALVRDEQIVRSRLSELFLELVVDQEQKVAFIRQADTDDLETPILLRRHQLTFLDSAVLLYLRRMLAQSDVHGERAVVSRDDIDQQMSIYEPASNTDRSGFTKRIGNSIEKFRKFSILRNIRAAKDRYEVSPTLKLLFSAEEIQQLTLQYKTIASEHAPAELPEEGSTMTGDFEA